MTDPTGLVSVKTGLNGRDRWAIRPCKVGYSRGIYIQTLDRVRRVNDGSHICGKLEDRSDDIPVAFPAFHGVRIFLRPLLCDPVPVGVPLFLVGSMIDRFEVIGEGLAVLVCNVF